MVDINTLIQFLYSGDYLGLLQAIYVSAFGGSSIFYAVVTMLFTTPLYIRTKSLLFLCIAWVLIGGFVAAAIPTASGFAILLLGFGFAGMLFKLFSRVRGGGR